MGGSVGRPGELGSICANRPGRDDEAGIRVCCLDGEEGTDSVKRTAHGTLDGAAL